MISYSHFLFCALLDDFPFRKRKLLSADKLIFLMPLSRKKDYITLLCHADSTFYGRLSVRYYLIFAVIHV